MSKDKCDLFKKNSPANLRGAAPRRPIFSHPLQVPLLKLEWSRTSNHGDTFSSVITAAVELLNLKEQEGKVDIKSEIFDSAMKSVDEKLKEQKGKVDVESEVFDSAARVLYEKLKEQKGKGDTDRGGGL